MVIGLSDSHCKSAGRPLLLKISVTFTFTLYSVTFTELSDSERYVVK